DSLHQQWVEALHIISRAWNQEVLEWDSKHFRIPPTQVIPKPVQRPHPPLLAACSKPDTAIDVGRMGLGALNFSLGPNSELADHIKAYRQAVRASAPTEYGKTEHFAMTACTLVGPSDREACRHGARGTRFFREGLGYYFFSPSRPIGRMPLSRKDLSESE